MAASAAHGKKNPRKIDEYGQSRNSWAAELNVAAPLKITRQPEDYKAERYNYSYCSVAVSGEGPFTFEWYVKLPDSSEYELWSTKYDDYKTSGSSYLSFSTVGSKVYVVVTDRFGRSVTSDTANIIE